ncbi:MAG: ribonuclease HI family protein [Syntrophobacterales bacterium]|nr:MAG: ribonuclease HI family protein [Syntrophobacterales bacterium]
MTIDEVKAKGILQLYVDGASRGNPGEAGAGFCLLDEDGNELLNGMQFLGRMTNNAAEYHALILGLREALGMGGTSIEIYTDSELVAKQIKGIYNVRNRQLRRLYRETVELLNKFHRYEMISIRREENRKADRLANEAIDGQKA